MHKKVIRRFFYENQRNKLYWLIIFSQWLVAVFQSNNKRVREVHDILKTYKTAYKADYLPIRDYLSSHAFCAWLRQDLSKLG